MSSGCLRAARGARRPLTSCARLLGAATASLALLAAPPEWRERGARAGTCEGFDGPSRGASSSRPCAVSVVVSPYHLAYPMLFMSVELRLADWSGLSIDGGVGSYRGATVGALGARLPLYFVGSFDGGLQIGPFARVSAMRYARASSVDAPPIGGAHEIGDVVYRDVEVARANGRSAAMAGLLVGGKYVYEVFTFQLGFLIGYHALVGRAVEPASPDATRKSAGPMAQLYAEIGWSF